MVRVQSVIWEANITVNGLMKLRFLPKHNVISVGKCQFHSGQSSVNSSQDATGLQLCGEKFLSKLLNRQWMLSSPFAHINQVVLSQRQRQPKGGLLGNISFSNNLNPALGDSVLENNEQLSSFYVVRDDLLHPLVNGNKARKLDALLPLLEDYFVTDVVTCGGCQSAHAAAVAVSCADRGLKSHLLLRGEQPETLTGYNLISTLYGNVSYIPRSVYAKRDEMLRTHAELVAGASGSVLRLADIFESSFMNHAFEKENTSPTYTQRDDAVDTKKVVLIEEGSGNVVGLLGVIRLVQYLSQNNVFGKEKAVKIIVDAGTGTTAVGLGLGAVYFGLPWEITAVMLADTLDAYKRQEEHLISEFCRCCSLPVNRILNIDGVVHWVEPNHPRKFGNIMRGEIELCQQIAQQTGILLDPVYTLAAWELATQLSQETEGSAKVVMLHSGGSLGMFGLAQRYKSYFQMLENCSSTNP